MLRLLIAPNIEVSKATKIPPVKRASRSPALTAPGHSPPKAKKSTSSKEAEVPVALEGPEDDLVATIRRSPKRTSRSPGLAAPGHSVPKSKIPTTTEETEEAIGISIF